MKKINLILSLFVMLAINLPLAHADEKVVIGEVKYVSGEAKVGANELKVGSKIFNDDVIATEKAGMVRLVLLNEGIAVQVIPESKIRFTKDERKPLRASIIVGGLLSKVKKQTEKTELEHYEVVSKHAAVGTRGATFFMKMEKGENTFLCTCDGAVDVTRGNSSLEITATHHDSPKTISPIGMNPAAAMGSEHSDKDIAELEKILK